MLPQVFLGFTTLIFAVTALPTDPQSTTSSKAVTLSSTKPEETKKASSTKSEKPTSTYVSTTSTYVFTTSTKAAPPITTSTSVKVTTKASSTSFTSVKVTTKASSTSSSAAATSTVNNGQQFVNKCRNTGISIADCAQLLNTAAANGNTIWRRWILYTSSR
ncbi:hypothetical protein B0A48_18285 [Cryoendolithus antarcticus]|uniref:LysM domain-containing protein n=1 Tax=Cryoendolithus antarcticus TaxID=1507870 RepID=A0A1V8S9A0_9PEZI|nr:hypothetical protein B0A48_18285 [Cryoendolithus antarcticus]